METSSNTRHHSVNPITVDDNKFKDSGIPQTATSHSYSSENVILRKDIPRPCAVIGPGVIPSYHRVDGYMPHIWPQPSDGSPTYYRHPQVQFCSDRAYPPRNISPRHTFQENMNRIIVPSPSEVKFRNYSGASQGGSVVLPESTKPNILPDTKFCDEPVLVNPRPVDLVRSQYNRNNDVPLRHEVQGAAVPQYAVHGYPVNKIHNASASPYSNVYNCPPEFQRYPLEYQNPGIQLVKNNPIYQKLPEQSSFIVANEYPGSKYSRMNNIRYEPYPPIKDKYIHPRFDYTYPYSNQYPAAYSTIPKCNDMRKRNFIPPDMKYYQMPQKYIEAHTLLPNSEFRPKISARRSQYHLADIPAHSIDPYAPQGKVYGFNICDKTNQYTVNPRTIPESGKLRIDYYNHYRGLPYPDTHLLHDSMQSQNCNKSNIYAYPMKPPDVNNSYSSLNNVSYQKPGDEQHDRINEYDAVSNQKFYYNQRHGSGTYNPLAKIPTEFSPNIISPTESSTSFDSLHTVSHQLYQEDGGYVSQCSTTSGKSADYQLLKNSNDKQLYHESNRRVNNMVNFMSSNNPERECDKSSVKSRNMKASMDLRQFLEMWDEEFEDSKVVKTHPDANNKTDSGYANYAQFVSENPMPVSEQLYVLDKVNIADGDLHKYEHLQKVTELPGNIKDCDQADNIKKNISKLNRVPVTNNSFHHLNVKKDKLNANVKPMYDLQDSMYNIPTNELVDVEAKISQSIIHKDVGCNFEIKPCSPGRPVQMKVEIQHDFNNHSVDINKKKNYANQIIQTNKMQPLEFSHIYESKEKVLKNNSNSNNKPIADVRNSSFMPMNDFIVRKTCYVDTSLPPIVSPIPLSENSADQNSKKSLCANENRETVLHKTNYDANRKIEQKSEPSKMIISNTLGVCKENSLMDRGHPNLFHSEKNNELNGDIEFKSTEKTYHKSREEIDVGMEMCPKGYEGFLEKLKLKTSKVLGNIDEVNQFKQDGILAKHKEIIKNDDSIRSPLKCFKNMFEASDSKMDFHLSKELTKLGEVVNVSDIVKIAVTTELNSDGKVDNYQLGSQKRNIPKELETRNLSPKGEQKLKNLEDAELLKENKKSSSISEKLNGALNFVELPNIHTDFENTEGMVLMDIPRSIKTHQMLKSTPTDKSTQPIIKAYNEETENIATCLTVSDTTQEVATHILLGEKFTDTNTLSQSKSLPIVDTFAVQNCNGVLHNRPILNMCLGDIIPLNTIKECDLLSKFNPLLESSYINDKEIIKHSYDEGNLSPKIRDEKDNSTSHIETSTISVTECNKMDKSDTLGVSVIKDMISSQPFANANIKINNTFEKKMEIQDASFTPAQINPEKVEKIRSSISDSKQENVLATANDSKNNFDFKMEHSRTYNVENETKMSNPIFKPHLIHIEEEKEEAMQMMSSGIKEYIRHESTPDNIFKNLSNLDTNFEEPTNCDEKEPKIQDVILKQHYIHIEGTEKNLSGKNKKNISYASKTYIEPDNDLNKVYLDPEESRGYNDSVISKLHIEETEMVDRIQENTICKLTPVDDSDSQLNNTDSHLKNSTSTNEIIIQKVSLKPNLINVEAAKETVCDGILEKNICSSISDSAASLNNLSFNPDKSIGCNENETTVHNENLKPHSIYVEKIEETMCDEVQANSMYISSSVDGSERDLNNIDSNLMKSISCNENEIIIHDEILEPHSIHVEEVEESVCDEVQENSMYVSNSIDDSGRDLNNIDSNLMKSVSCNENETIRYDEIVEPHSTHTEEVEDTTCDKVQENSIYISNSIDNSGRDLNNIDSHLMKSISCNENGTIIHDDILEPHSIHVEEVEMTMCAEVQENSIYVSNSIDDSGRDLNNIDSNLMKPVSCDENETIKYNEIVEPHSIHTQEVEDATCDNVQENSIYISNSIDDSGRDLNNIDSNLMKPVSCDENETIKYDEIVEPHSIHNEEVEDTTCDNVQENSIYISNSIDDSGRDLNNIDSHLMKSISCNENGTIIHDDILEPHSIHVEEVEMTMCAEVQENSIYVSNSIDDSDRDLNNIDSNLTKSVSHDENETLIHDDILEPHSIHVEEVELTMCAEVQENSIYVSNSIDDSDRDLNNIDSNLKKSVSHDENETLIHDEILEPHSMHIEEVENTTYDEVQKNSMYVLNCIDDSGRVLNNIDSNLTTSVSSNENGTIIHDEISKHIKEVEVTMCDEVQGNSMYVSNSVDDSDRDLNNIDSKLKNSISCNENETIIHDGISEPHVEEVEDSMYDGVQENIIYASNSFDSTSSLNNLDSDLNTSISYNKTTIHDEILKSHLIHIEGFKKSMTGSVQENVRHADLNDNSDCTLNNLESKPDESTSCNENETKMQDINLKSPEETAEIVSDRMKENIICTLNINDSDDKKKSLSSNTDESASEIIMENIFIRPHLIHIEELEAITYDSISENTSIFIDVSDCNLNNLDSNPDDSTCHTESETKMHNTNLIKIEEVEETISDDIQTNVSNPIVDSDSDLNNLASNSKSINNNENEANFQEIISKPHIIPEEESEGIGLDKIQKKNSYAYNSGEDCTLDKLTSGNESKTQMQDVIVNPFLINVEEKMNGIQEDTEDVSITINDHGSNVDNLVSNTEESTSYNVDERIIQNVLIKQDVMQTEEAKNIISDGKKKNTTYASNSVRDLNNVDSSLNKSISYTENKPQMQDIVLNAKNKMIEDPENTLNILSSTHDSHSDLNNLDSNMKELTNHNENKKQMHGVILLPHSIHIEETEDTVSDGTAKNIKCSSIVHDSDTDLDNIDSNPEKSISHDVECEIRKQDIIFKPKFIHIEEAEKNTPKISGNIQEDIKCVSNSINDSDTDLDSNQDKATCFNIANVRNAFAENVFSKHTLYINDEENDTSLKKLNHNLIEEFNNDLNSRNEVLLTSESNTNELPGIISENSLEKYQKCESFRKKGNDCVKVFDENKKPALMHSIHKIEKPSSPRHFEETDSSLILLTGDVHCKEENYTEKSLPLPYGDVSVHHTLNVDELQDTINNRTDTLLEISILETHKEICISNIKNIVLDAQLHSIEFSVQPETEELNEIVSENENVLLYEIQSPMYPQCDAFMESAVSNDIAQSSYVKDSRTYSHGDTSVLNEVLEDTKIDENVVEFGGCLIEDIACVETVISDEPIFQSEDEIATSASPPEISWGPSTSDSEADEYVPYPIQRKLDCTEDIFKDSNSNFILKNCKLELIKLPDRMSGEEDECHGSQSSTEVQSKKSRSLKLVNVNSTDLTKKRNHSAIAIHDEKKDKISTKKIKLDDTNFEETLVERYVEKIKKIPSLNTRSNLFSKGKLITKGAQKYIPPDDTHNHKLKCQLPLPENILLSLSKHNLRNVEYNESRHKINLKVDKHTRSQNNKLPKKSRKPNFEDVLKQIDETNISWSKKKLKRCLNSNKSIPKMIIKKNETGCHYTSIPGKKAHAPDLTGNKWQPWVCLQRNINIEKMVKAKSLRTVFYNCSTQNKEHTLFCPSDNGKCNNFKLSPSRALNYIL